MPRAPRRRAAASAQSSAARARSTSASISGGANMSAWRRGRPSAQTVSTRTASARAGSRAAIIDDPEAYRVLLDTLAAHDPDRAEAVRVDTVWAEGRPLRSALMFTPPNVLADVERALAHLR